MRTVTLADGATLADAIAAAGFSAEGLKTGIFGAVAGPQTVLKEGDRVEIYRPLALDPKEARRKRAEDARRAGRRASPRPARKTRV
ncbi:MAG: RnfH family protein [Clostridia bacterium]